MLDVNNNDDLDVELLVQKFLLPHTQEKTDNGTSGINGSSSCDWYSMPSLPVLGEDVLEIISEDTETQNDSSARDTVDTTSGIPEMLEDAHEIISEDTDFMKSMGISGAVQCMYCGWAGSIVLLESHIRKNHTFCIHKVDTNVWVLTYTLQSLLLQLNVWLHKVIEFDSTLYMISVKYVHVSCFRVRFLLLSPDLLEPQEKIFTITLFNKRTGQAFSWSGPITILPPISPGNIKDCFKIDLAKLDLLHNNPPIQDIFIIFFVRLSI
ncbi:uncharacterized protein [Maniola hyperantus]